MIAEMWENKRKKEGNMQEKKIKLAKNRENTEKKPIFPLRNEAWFAIISLPEPA